MRLLSGSFRSIAYLTSAFNAPQTPAAQRRNNARPSTPRPALMLSPVRTDRRPPLAVLGRCLLLANPWLFPWQFPWQVSALIVRPWQVFVRPWQVFARPWQSLGSDDEIRSSSLITLQGVYCVFLSTHQCHCMLCLLGIALV